MGAGIYPNLVNKGPIVMVSINYRLGPFGFFSTRQMTAPGNWAISDWIEALNWVQRYISFFGGDPNRVTIGGQSSGAEAVSTLTLTPLAKSMSRSNSNSNMDILQTFSNSQFTSLEVHLEQLSCHIPRKQDQPVSNYPLN